MKSVIFLSFLFFFFFTTTPCKSSESLSISFNPWQAFLKLSGCRLGSNNTFGLSYLKRYLSNFGYLPYSHTYDDDFDNAFEAAILLYQQNFQLNTTGFLDRHTIDLMILPRCGVPDIVNGTAMMHGRRNLYSYFPRKPVWPRRKLTYTFLSNSDVPIPTSVLRTVFSRSFSRWAEATLLTFTEVKTVNQADIVLEFLKWDHGDGESFDGMLGTLAHAFSPTDGRLHFDASELWTAVKEDSVPEDLHNSRVAIDLESVAVHEIGHLLGLGHSSVVNSVMYPSIRTQMRRVYLEADDVDGIQSLYGVNPNYNGTYTGTLVQFGQGRVSEAGGGAGGVVWRNLLAAVVLALFVS